MWEFSLYFNRSLLPYFENFKIWLKTLLKNEINCVAIGTFKDDFVLMMAFDKKTYNSKILAIKKAIANIICMHYKPSNITSKIDNFNLSNKGNIFLLYVLYCMDIKSDIAEIVSRLSLIEELYLNSFVHFKLTDIEKRWQDVGSLINQNSLFLVDDAIKKELMQFLMNGIKSDKKCLKLLLKSGEIKIFDDGKIVEKQKSFLGRTDADNTLFTLIYEFPEKIEIEGYKKFSVHFISDLYQVFGDRVKFLE